MCITVAVYLIIWCTILIQIGATDSGFSEFAAVNSKNNVDSFIKTRMLKVKKDLSASFSLKYRHKRGVDRSEVVFGASTYINNTANLTPITSIQQDGQTYFMGEKGLYEFDLFKNEFNHIEITLENSGSVTFITTAKWGNATIFLLGNSQGYCQFYKRSTLPSPLPIQTVSVHGKPLTAEFFWNRGILHCAILSRGEDMSGRLIFYVWTGTHFDQIETLHTMNPIAMVTFPDENQTIIVLATSFEENKSMSMILRLQDGVVEKLQYISFKETCANCLVHYHFNEDHFVVCGNLILRWDVNSLHPWFNIKIEDNDKIQAVTVGYFLNQPLILLSFKSRILSYLPNKETIRMAEDFWESKEMQITGVKLQPLFDKSSTMLVFTNDKNGFISVSVSVQLKSQDVLSSRGDPILLSLSTLRDLLAARSKQISWLAEQNELLLRTDADIKFPGVMNSSRETIFHNGALFNGRFNSKTVYISPDDILNQLVNLNVQLQEINQHASKLLYKSKPNEINGNLIVSGSIVGEEFSFNRLRVSTLGRMERLLPSHSDSNHYSKTIHTILAKHITIRSPGHILEDCLLTYGDQRITGRYSTGMLTARNIFLPMHEAINGIILGNIVSPGLATGLIEGTKTFPNIYTKSVHHKIINKIDTEEWIRHLIDGDRNSHNDSVVYIVDNILTHELFVKHVNSIDWNKFKSSLILKGSKSVLYGNLFLQLNSHIDSLFVNTVHGIPVNSLLTRTTNQDILSNITIMSNMYTQEIQAGLINGIEFGKNIAKFGETNYISTPTTILQLYVQKNLTLNNDMNVDKHVIGMHTEDLLQMYTGKVTIRGSLTINNLQLEEKSKVFVGEHLFDMNIVSTFWMKSIDQEISIPVTFLNGIQAPQVFTSRINGHDFVNFLKTDIPPEKNVSCYFKSIVINRHFTLNSSKSSSLVPDLSEIVKSAVRLTGRYILTGSKVFKDELGIGSLQVGILDNTAVSDLVHKDNLAHTFIGIKKVSKVYAVHVESPNQTLITQINNMSFPQVLDSVVMADKATSLSTLHINKVRSDNIKLTIVNELDITALALTASFLVNGGGGTGTVYVTGDVICNGINHIQSINDIDLETYLTSVVSSAVGGQVGGNKHFKQSLTITGDFEVSNVGKINIDDLYSYSLSKTKDQNITEPHEFNSLKSAFMIADEIAGVSTDLLIDLQKTYVDIYSPLAFTDLEVLGDLATSWLPCHFHTIAEHLDNLPTRLWGSVIVEGDCNAINNGKINNIVDNSVTYVGVQEITGKVRFDGHVSMSTMKTVRYINNVDLSAIANDSLTKTGQDTFVVGVKTFNGKVWISGAEVRDNMQTPIVNSINIGQLNSTLVWNGEDSIIYGRKVFLTDLRIPRVYIMNALVHGINPEDIVFPNSSRIIPKTHFKTAEITGHLEARNVNNRHLDEFLESRINLNGPSQDVYSNISFSHLHVVAPSYIYSINNIQLHELVYISDVKEVQTIRGCKRFTQDIHISGNVDVKLLNGLELATIYNDAILRDQDVYLNQSVTFGATVALKNGLVASNYEDAFWLNWKPEPHIDTSSQTEQIEEAIGLGLDRIQLISGEYLYMEPAYDLNLPALPSMAVTPVYAGPQTTLSVWRKAPGSECGLPMDCPCSVQYMVDISEGKSITVLPGNATHRVFSFYEGDIAVDVFTNAVSSSSTCRSEMKQSEHTYISWMTAEKGGSFSAPWVDIHIDSTDLEGYVNDAKMFQSQNNTYVVLAEYYDFSSTSYNAGSLVLQLDSSINKALVVQSIPSIGAAKLDIFYSNQGTLLIVCNDYSDMDPVRQVQIFRFNEDILQFELLRSISSEGCGLITNAVFEKESLIILGDATSNTLHVLRYQETWDNFFYYQHILFDSDLRGISVFYSGAAGASDAYLSATTSDGSFYVYEYTFIQGWKLNSRGYLKDVQGTAPFKLSSDQYLFLTSTHTSSALAVLINGIC